MPDRQRVIVSSVSHLLTLCRTHHRHPAGCVPPGPRTSPSPRSPSASHPPPAPSRVDQHAVIGMAAGKQFNHAAKRLTPRRRKTAIGAEQSVASSGCSPSSWREGLSKILADGTITLRPGGWVAACDRGSRLLIVRYLKPGCASAECTSSFFRRKFLNHSTGGGTRSRPK